MSQVLENRRSIGDRAAPQSLNTHLEDFALLSEPSGQQPRVWLDNAATAVVRSWLAYHDRFEALVASPKREGRTAVKGDAR